MPEIEIPVERARIVLRVAVSAASEEHVEGLLDTGATRSFVSSDLVERIGAVSHGSATVTGMEITDEEKPTYLVHVRVPAPQLVAKPAEDHFLSRVVAVGANHRFDGRHPTTPCDVLLGMDLISQWRVEISDGRCTIGWRAPTPRPPSGTADNHEQ